MRITTGYLRGTDEGQLYPMTVPSQKKIISWYGVRTLFRLVATGKPRWTDRYFDPASTLVEDRIVLFQATDSDDVVRQAKAEARRYCKATRYANIYGQNVHLRFLGATDAFSMVDSPTSMGCEVYSTTAIVPNSVRDARVVTKWWGKTDRRAWQARNKFIDGKILTDALTAMKKSETKRSPRPVTRRRSHSEA